MANNWVKKLAPLVVDVVVGLFKRLGKKKPEPKIEDPYKQKRATQVIRLRAIRKKKAN